jgi:predicted ATP-dependent endonuclease of OLD family
MIKQIVAKNYRCFKDIKIDLNDFNILVGQNGSGKSSFLDIINIFRDFVRMPSINNENLIDISYSPDKPVILIIEFDITKINDDYNSLFYNLVFDTRDKQPYSYTESFYLAIPGQPPIGVKRYDIRSLLHKISDNIFYNPNLIIPDNNMEDWLDHIRTVFPNIDNITDKYIYYKNGSRVNINSSKGLYQFLKLTSIPYHDHEGIFIFETPEYNIHPLNTESILQSLSSIYDGQVFISTHSPMMLNMVKIKDLLCFTKNDDGSVSIIPGNEHPYLKEWKGIPCLGTLFAGGVLDQI